MKKLFLGLLTVLLLAGAAYSIDQTAEFTWDQPCIDGCPGDVPPTGPVGGWRIYMSDVSGSYGSVPIVDLPYDGTPAPSYTSNYILALSGAGIKYFVVTAYDRDNPENESGYSNEENYPYNFAGAATPVSFTFTIQSP